MCTLAAAEPFVKPARKRRAARSKPPDNEAIPRESLQQPATNF
jgi:hypothetical protein